MTARKVSVELLKKSNGELGIYKGDYFEALLNFDFEIVCKVTRGGSGAVYRVQLAGESSRYTVASSHGAVLPKC